MIVTLIFSLSANSLLMIVTFIFSFMPCRRHPQLFRCCPLRQPQRRHRALLKIPEWLFLFWRFLSGLSLIFLLFHFSFVFTLFCWLIRRELEVNLKWCWCYFYFGGGMDYDYLYMTNIYFYTLKVFMTPAYIHVYTGLILKILVKATIIL